MSAAPLNLYRWTREDFHKAIEAGAIARPDAVELVDGQIIEKMTHHPRHAVAIRRISRLFESALGATHDIRPQLPIALSDRSEPEPDITVVPGTPDDYIVDHPIPDQIALLIEVADSSLERDRRSKIPLYGRAGVQEAWLVDVANRRLEIYREPSPIGYRMTTIVDETKQISPLVAPEMAVEVSALLPPKTGV